MNHRSENAKTLASLVGLPEEEAAKLLEVAVAVTFDETDERAAFLAGLIVQILGRTIAKVPVNATDGATAEIVVGAGGASLAQHIRVVMDDAETRIGSDVDGAVIWPAAPNILMVFAACYATGRVLRFVLGDRLKVPGLASGQPFAVPHSALLGEDASWLERPIVLEDTYLAGAGAIGSGFAFAVRFLTVSGTLGVIDPKCVSDGNLNRCTIYDTGDIGAPKARTLSAWLEAAGPGLKVTSAVTTVREFAKTQSSPAWLKRLIVGVDSRRVRRSLQGEIPGEVFDASTTGAEEVVFHHHSQPTETACLSCIYYQDEAEFARERHVAETLGVSVENIKEHYVAGAPAEKIAAKYGMAPGELVGKAYDTLFKALCSEGRLMAADGKQALAPFAFVSVLAGAVLAVELARRMSLGAVAATFNYWRLSPWHPPVIEQQSVRPRRAQCEFCGDAVIQQVITSVWGSSPE